MNNASDNVKKHATFITDDQYNNGIYKFLVKNYLISPSIENSVCFFDIDGTLLQHGKKQINDNTIYDIKTFIKNGGKAVIATGRNYNQAIKYAKSIGVNNLICSNGADVYFKDNNIYTEFMPTEVCKDIIFNLQKLNIHYAFEDHKNIYVVDCHDVSEIEKKINSQGIINIDIRQNLDLTSNFQMWAVGTKEEMDVVLKLNINGVKIIRWDDNAIEFTINNINKSTGITKLLQNFDFEVMTYSFGDGENDLEMFSDTDISISMGNASEKVKSNSTFTTKNVEDNGVGFAMKKFGLIERN
jgi:Cof subfamily protein (haloacid dehalogenase superfamily)